MILNRQRRVRIPIRTLENFFARVCRRLRLPASSVCIALVTDAHIARWNRSYRRKPRPTDVLSFPAGDSKAKRLSLAKYELSRKDFSSTSCTSFTSSNFYLGDIAIAPAVARRNARRLRRSFTQEMKILILHGILHLMGYDHETDTGQMDRFEQRLRRELGLG